VKKKEAISLIYNTNDCLVQKSNIAIHHLPDLRGELISGKVVNLKDSNPIDNTIVSLSIPGEDLNFITAVANKEGRFYFK
jgi:hypothetical protein